MATNFLEDNGIIPLIVGVDLHHGCKPLVHGKKSAIYETYSLGCCQPQARSPGMILFKWHTNRNSSLVVPMVSLYYYILLVFPVDPGTCKDDSQILLLCMIRFGLIDD